MKFFKFLDEALEDRVYKLNNEVVDKDDFYDMLINLNASDSQMITLERKGIVTIGDTIFSIEQQEAIPDEQIDYSEVNDDFGEPVKELEFNTEIDDCFDGECDDENVLHPVLPTATDNEENPPSPVGADTGISNEIIGAIKDEWEAIEKYNSLIQTVIANESPFATEITKILSDIVNEENLHVGQLQKALELLSPNVSSITKGEDEAEEVILDAAKIQSPIQVERVGDTLFGNVNPALCGDDYDNSCLIADSDIDDDF